MDGGLLAFLSFNTQPPEGGWDGCCLAYAEYDSFNTQPPEGGWPLLKFKICI